MNKILKPNRLRFPLLSFLLILLTFSGIFGCGHADDKTVRFPLPSDTCIEHHAISIEVARDLTARFRASIDSFNIHCPGFKDSMQFGHAESFPTDVFIKLLTQYDPKVGFARGIRMYWGRGVAGEIKLVLVPYDSSGNDMINHLVDVSKKPAPGNTKTEVLKTTDGQAIEDGQRCPTACDDGGSGLN